MKKFYILAAVALVASSACTKIENVETTAPDQAIAFQVAKYTTQTKADSDSHGHTSLIDEGYYTFKTWAWYTPATGTANQAFMSPATIGYDASNKLWHATDRTYFWPKTGYVNFFSFAGSKQPTTVALDASALCVANYTDQTIETDDNILAADGAYGYYSNPGVTHGLNGVTSGVPTLFRHMLSRVKFDINVDAREVTDNKNKWEVTVNSVVVKYRNQGSLVITYPATPAISFDANGHPTSAGTTQGFTSAVWTPKSVANAQLTKVSGDVKPFAVGGQLGTAVELIADSVVMPQDLTTTTGTNATFELNYTITHTYNGANPVVETVPVAAKTLVSFATSATSTTATNVTQWERNTIYTYHITIKPNGEILFDPAVEAWVSETEEPSYVIE